MAVEECKEKGTESPSFEAIKDRVLAENAPSPTIEDAKDLFRFAIDSSKGYITYSGRPSMESTKTVVENLYRAFSNKTGTETDPKQHSEIYRVGVPTLGLPFSQLTLTLG